MKKKIGEKLLNKYSQNYIKYHEENNLYLDFNSNAFLNYGNKIVPTNMYGNQMIIDRIRDGKPFMIGRLGETELRVIMSGLLNEFPVINPLRKRKILLHECYNWCDGAGFFPKDINLVPDFTRVYLEACKEVDILAVWFNRYEDYISDIYAPQAEICRFQTLNMFLLKPDYEDIWTKELAGKKVLVISPFAETIKNQYKNRDQLFFNKNILPEFELKTVKAVQSPLIMGEKSQHKNWFEALDYMFEETLKLDYDIAILGCGAYGFPLAAKIKQSGHMAIQLCGQTQILFGIKGKRWEKMPEFLEKVENEFWVRPDVSEIPKNKEAVENGCYW